MALKKPAILAPLIAQFLIENGPPGDEGAESMEQIIEDINLNHAGDEDDFVEVSDGYYVVGQTRKYPGKFINGHIKYVRGGRTVAGENRWRYSSENPTKDEIFKKNDPREAADNAGTVTTVRKTTTIWKRKVQQLENTEKFMAKETQRRASRRARRYAAFAIQALEDLVEDLVA